MKTNHWMIALLGIGPVILGIRPVLAQAQPCSSPPSASASAAVALGAANINTGRVSSAINLSGPGYAVSANYLDGVGAATASGTGTLGSDGADAYFYFCDGAPTNTTARLDFTGVLDTSVSGTLLESEAGVTIYNPGSTEIGVCSQSVGYNVCSTGEPSSFSGSVTFTAPTNTWELVQLYAQGSTNNGSAAVSWNAFADPSITLDALDTSGGTLEFSADLPDSVLPSPPVTGVPEPDTLMLAMLGLVGLGLTWVRRRGWP